MANIARAEGEDGDAESNVYDTLLMMRMVLVTVSMHSHVTRCS